MICAGNDRQFRSLAEAIAAPELADDARFLTNDLRVANRDELRPLLERPLEQRRRAEWAERLASAGVPAGAVQTTPEAFAYADKLGLEVVDELDGVRTVAFPARLSATPTTTRRAPPALDEDGTAIRAWLRAR